MMEDGHRDPLAPGSVVHGSVLLHHPWGIEIAIDEVDAYGTVDLLFLSDEPEDMDPGRFPPLGSRLRAVVQGLTPNGQLRLTVRVSDLQRAAAAGEDGADVGVAD